MWNWGSIYDSICQTTTSDNTNVASRFKAPEKVCTRGIDATKKQDKG